MDKFSKPQELQRHKSVYIAGKITGVLDTYKENFEIAKVYLESKGLLVMNPAILPEGFPHQSYMPICYAMIDACDAVVFLHDWEDSKGAGMEFGHAVENDKPRYLFDEIIKEDALDQLIDLREEKRSDMAGPIKDGDADSVFIKDFLALDWALRNLK